MALGPVRDIELAFAKRWTADDLLAERAHDVARFRWDVRKYEDVVRADSVIMKKQADLIEGWKVKEDETQAALVVSEKKRATWRTLSWLTILGAFAGGVYLGSR